MLNLHSRAERETRKFYQDHYFLTDPDKFIFEFFPIHSEWQLMERPITIQVYSNPSLFTTLAFYEYPYLRGIFTKVAWHFSTIFSNFATIFETFSIIY